MVRNTRATAAMNAKNPKNVKKQGDGKRPASEKTPSALPPKKVRLRQCPKSSSPERRESVSPEAQLRAALSASRCKTLSTTSNSGVLRVKGNKLYEQFISSTNFQDQKRYLEAAVDCYKQAYESALAGGESPDCPKESSSAAKNCATALYKLAHVFIESKAMPDAIDAHYRSSIEYFSKALYFGQSCMEDKWLNDLKNRYEISFVESLDFIKSKLSNEKIPGAMEQQINVMVENSHKASTFWEIAQIEFQRGVVALGTKDFKTALHALNECRRPLTEMERVLSSAGNRLESELTTELSILLADLDFHLATAESLQAITIADKLLKEAINNLPAGKKKTSLSPNLVYDIIDWYRKSIVLSREIEVEIEALALSRMGCVYDEVLKFKAKAKEYFLRCIQLGLTFNRKDPKSEAWFRIATSAIARYQMEATRNDDVAIQQERERHLEELSDELAKLEKGKYGATSAELIRFIYTTFPPKDPSHKLPEDELKEDGNVKKGLLKAILHYHPDKQDVEKHGKKWQALCGELTRALTARYENCKLG